MKHSSTFRRFAAALSATVFTLAAPSAQAADPPATTAKAADVAPKPDVPVDEDYRLGPGDKLRIEVYKDPQLSQALQVRPDGKITLPLIGDLDANGRTPLELRDRIVTSLKEYINNPVVTVIVVEATAATAFVVGEVNHPGAVTLQGGLTVLQALALAGGLKDFANQRNIRVLRKSTAGVRTISFDYRSAVKGGGTPMYLRPGDTIVVPD